MKGQVTIFTILNVSMGLFGTIATTNYVRRSRWNRWSINILAGTYKPSGTEFLMVFSSKLSKS
jgi:hypothetical protein